MARHMLVFLSYTPYILNIKTFILKH